MKTMKNKENEQISKELLKLAIGRYMENTGNALLEEMSLLNREEGEALPTKKQIIKFRKLCNREFKKRKKIVTIPYKVAVAAAVLLVAFNISVVFVPAVKNVVLNFLTKTEKTHTEISISDEEFRKKEQSTIHDRYRVSLDKEYQITELPKEFQVLKETKTFNSLTIEYGNAQDEHEIEYHQCIDSATINLDTERAVVTYVDIKGYQAMVVEKKERVTVIWRQDGYFIEVTSLGIEKKDLIKVAKSVKKVNKKTSANIDKSIE